jgi:hypothetical protein
VSEVASLHFYRLKMSAVWGVFNTIAYPGFAWLIRRVLDLMMELIGPLYNWLQKFTYHYLTHCHLLSTGHSTGTILTSKIHYSVVLLCIPSRWLCLLITPRTDPTENTVFCCQECVFIGPLPNNGCPSIVERVCFGNVFTEPLPSNGHMRRNSCK